VTDWLREMELSSLSQLCFFSLLNLEGEGDIFGDDVMTKSHLMEEYGKAKYWAK
jgi:hypothetical protein